MTPYTYKCTLDRVIDGDTIDVHIDLGFDVWLNKQRVRLAGIDTPESRTRNLANGTLTLVSHGTGKYGRILGTPYTEEGSDMCKTLISEGHAVEYWGGKKVKVWG
jgi:endonuclease YncB( thermonuclease family)